MARLNIEDQFWMEIMGVSVQFPSLDAAVGNAIRFFRYAQEKHKQGIGLTENEFRQLGFSEALMPLFARRTEAGIFAAGSDKFFGWLDQKIESGRRGGSVSSDAKKLAAQEREKAKRETTEENHKQPQASTSETLKAQPSPSPSPSEELNTAERAAVDKPTRRKRQERFDPKSIEELRAAFDPDTRQLWRDLYPDSTYRERESLKAWDYYRDSGPKRPTTLAGWKRVMGRWFERGWPRHAAGIPGKPQRIGPAPIHYPSVDQVEREQEESRKSNDETHETVLPIDMNAVHPAVRAALGRLKKSESA